MSSSPVDLVSPDAGQNDEEMDYGEEEQKNEDVLGPPLYRVQLRLEKGNSVHVPVGKAPRNIKIIGTNLDILLTLSRMLLVVSEDKMQLRSRPGEDCKDSDYAIVSPGVISHVLNRGSKLFYRKERTVEHEVSEKDDLREWYRKLANMHELVFELAACRTDEQKREAWNKRMADFSTISHWIDNGNGTFRVGNASSPADREFDTFLEQIRKELSGIASRSLKTALKWFLPLSGSVQSEEESEDSAKSLPRKATAAKRKTRVMDSDSDSPRHRQVTERSQSPVQVEEPMYDREDFAGSCSGMCASSSREQDEDCIWSLQTSKTCSLSLVGAESPSSSRAESHSFENTKRRRVYSLDECADRADPPVNIDEVIALCHCDPEKSSAQFECPFFDLDVEGIGSLAFALNFNIFLALASSMLAKDGHGKFVLRIDQCPNCVIQATDVVSTFLNRGSALRHGSESALVHEVDILDDLSAWNDKITEMVKFVESLVGCKEGPLKRSQVWESNVPLFLDICFWKKGSNFVDSYLTVQERPVAQDFKFDRFAHLVQARIAYGREIDATALELIGLLFVVVTDSFSFIGEAEKQTADSFHVDYSLTAPCTSVFSNVGGDISPSVRLNFDILLTLARTVLSSDSQMFHLNLLDAGKQCRPSIASPGVVSMFLDRGSNLLQSSSLEIKHMATDVDDLTNWNTKIGDMYAFLMELIYTERTGRWRQKSSYKSAFLDVWSRYRDVFFDVCHWVQVDNGKFVVGSARSEAGSQELLEKFLDLAGTHAVLNFNPKTISTSLMLCLVPLDREFRRPLWKTASPFSTSQDKDKLFWNKFSEMCWPLLTAETFRSANRLGFGRSFDKGSIYWADFDVEWPVIVLSESEGNLAAKVLFDSISAGSSEGLDPDQVVVVKFNGRGVRFEDWEMAILPRSHLTEFDPNEENISFRLDFTLEKLDEGKHSEFKRAVLLARLQYLMEQSNWRLEHENEVSTTVMRTRAPSEEKAPKLFLKPGDVIEFKLFANSTYVRRGTFLMFDNQSLSLLPTIVIYPRTLIPYDSQIRLVKFRDGTVPPPGQQFGGIDRFWLDFARPDLSLFTDKDTWEVEKLTEADRARIEEEDRVLCDEREKEIDRKVNQNIKNGEIGRASRRDRELQKDGLYEQFKEEEREKMQVAKKKEKAQEYSDSEDESLPPRVEGPLDPDYKEFHHASYILFSMVCRRMLEQGTQGALVGVFDSSSYQDTDLEPEWLASLKSNKSVNTRRLLRCFDSSSMASDAWFNYGVVDAYMKILNERSKAMAFGTEISVRGDIIARANRIGGLQQAKATAQGRIRGYKMNLAQYIKRLDAENEKIQGLKKELETNRESYNLAKQRREELVSEYRELQAQGGDETELDKVFDLVSKAGCALTEAGHSKEGAAKALKKAKAVSDEFAIRVKNMNTWILEAQNEIRKTDSEISVMTTLLKKAKEHLFLLQHGWEVESCYFFSPRFYNCIAPNGQYDPEGVQRWARIDCDFNWVALEKYNLVFFPVHRGNDHWALVLADLRRYEITYFDTSGSWGIGIVKNISEYLASIKALRRKSDRWESCMAMVSTHQSPEESCIYMMMFANCISAKMGFENVIGPEQIADWRNRIAMDILKNSASPSAEDFITTTIKSIAENAKDEKVRQDDEEIEKLLASVKKTITMAAGEVLARATLALEAVKERETLKNDMFAQMQKMETEIESTLVKVSNNRGSSREGDVFTKIWSAKRELTDKIEALGKKIIADINKQRKEPFVLDPWSWTVAESSAKTESSAKKASPQATVSQGDSDSDDLIHEYIAPKRNTAVATVSADEEEEISSEDSGHFYQR